MWAFPLAHLVWLVTLRLGSYAFPLACTQLQRFPFWFLLPQLGVPWFQTYLRTLSPTNQASWKVSLASCTTSAEPTESRFEATLRLVLRLNSRLFVNDLFLFTHWKLHCYCRGNFLCECEGSMQVHEECKVFTHQHLLQDQWSGNFFFIFTFFHNSARCKSVERSKYKLKCIKCGFYFLRPSLDAAMTCCCQDSGGAQLSSV